MSEAPEECEVLVAPKHDPNVRPSTLKAVFTDIQFWIPAAVLAGGIALLVFLH
jgi:hypothetical protein